MSTVTDLYPGTVVKVIPEHVIKGKRLGRHVRHDPRSLAYQVKPRAALAQSVDWKRQTSVLDQGDVGSCTGNATVGVLGTVPYYATLASRILAGLALDEAEAVRLYSAATKLDDYRGTYPPTDTGSDGLSVAKAAQAAGLIAGYLHCTSLDAVITALQAGPVITGVNWYDSFDSPDSAGLVSISANAQVRGGHEFELRGVDIEKKMIHAVNSWGYGWGAGGAFQFSFDDYARLLAEQGDATAFVPITSNPPVPNPPTPIPPGPGLDVPTAADRAYHDAVKFPVSRSRLFKAWAASKQF